MNRPQEIRIRRKEIFTELARIEQMRRGSVVEQTFAAVRDDGSAVEYGPYPLYSFKEKGRTVSRRIRNPELVPRYREQVAAMRRFETLILELVAMGEELGDLVLSEQEAQKKTPKPKSRRSSN